MNSDSSQQDLKAESEHITAVLQKYKGDLLSKPNGVGVAVGFQKKSGLSTQNLALVVLVDTKVAPDLLATDDQIPSSIEGVQVDVQEIGPLSAQ